MNRYKHKDTNHTGVWNWLCNNNFQFHSNQMNDLMIKFRQSIGSLPSKDENKNANFVSKNWESWMKWANENIKKL